MQNEIYLSVIMPVCNAESLLLESLNAMGEFLAQLSFSTEFIIVDDGSADRSPEIAREWALEQRPFTVRPVLLEKNRGKGGAVTAGMNASTGKYRVFIDVDLAYPPAQILRILKALEESNDVAVACRVHPESRYTISPSFFHYLYTRHVASRAINYMMRRTIIPHCRDSQAGLKGFSASAAKVIFSRLRLRGFSFDVEVLYLAEKLGFKICEVPVEYRYFNEPTTVAFMKDGFGMIRDVLAIRRYFRNGVYNLPSESVAKRLVINADDYGMTLPISRGILKAASTGSVRAISVMTNSSDLSVSMDELATSSLKLDVGLHATLTFGRPLSDPKEIPSLVNGNGNFFSRNELFLRSHLCMISANDVYIELKAQCKKLIERWSVVDHLDSHHHVHAYPTIRDAVVRVAHEFGIKNVRAPYEGLWSPWYKAFLRRWTVNLLKAARPDYWRKRGFVCANNFGGFSLRGGPDLMDRWQETLLSLPAGNSEIMVHPGFASNSDDNYNDGRELELSVLSDKNFLEMISSSGVELVDFRFNK